MSSWSEFCETAAVLRRTQVGGGGGTTRTMLLGCIENHFGVLRFAKPQVNTSWERAFNLSLPPDITPHKLFQGMSPSPITGRRVTCDLFSVRSLPRFYADTVILHTSPPSFSSQTQPQVGAVGKRNAYLFSTNRNGCMLSLLVVMWRCSSFSREPTHTRTHRKAGHAFYARLALPRTPLPIDEPGGVDSKLRR